MRKIVVAIADLHSGHWLGLCNPDVAFYDENERGEMVPNKPELKEIQKYLWGLYREHIERVVGLASSDEIILLPDGDLTHGRTFPEHLMRTRLSDQIDIAIANLVPWMDLPNVKRVRIHVGTSAHNEGEGSTERIIASHLQMAYPGIDTRVRYHSLIDIDEVKFDVAHHGPSGGSRSWLRGNVARYYLRDVMLKDIVAGNAPPRVVQRAHFHIWCREYLEVGNYEADLVVCPSYCAMGAYGRKVTRSEPYQTHGLVAYEIRDGHLYHVHKFTRKLDVRTKESIDG